MPLVSTGGEEAIFNNFHLSLSPVLGPFNVMDDLISHKSSIEYNIHFLCLEDIYTFNEFLDSIGGIR